MFSSTKSVSSALLGVRGLCQLLAPFPKLGRSGLALPGPCHPAGCCQAHLLRESLVLPSTDGGQSFPALLPRCLSVQVNCKTEPGVSTTRQGLAVPCLAGSGFAHFQANPIQLTFCKRCTTATGSVWSGTGGAEVPGPHSPGTPSSAAKHCPKLLAQVTHSSMLTFITGTKGQTSRAPMRGCSPGNGADMRMGTGNSKQTRRKDSPFPASFAGCALLHKESCFCSSDIYSSPGIWGIQPFWIRRVSTRALHGPTTTHASHAACCGCSDMPCLATGS